MNPEPARVRELATFCLLFAAMSGSREARAQDSTAAPAVSVAKVGCADLDIEETERLLRVELAVVAARAERPRAPTVTVACSNSTLHIEISDPVTQATRGFDVPAPQGTAGRERTVALAASQLFLSSWLEMIVREPPRKPEPHPDAPRVDKPPSLRSSHHARPEPEHEELSLAVGGKAHDLGQPFASAGLELLGVRVFDRRWFVGLRAAGENGTAQRSSGAIHSRAFAFGVLGGLRFDSGAWELDAAACLGLSVLHASGEPSVMNAVGSSATGSAAELALLAGPALRLPPFRVALSAEAGLLEPAISLRTAHDRTTRLDALWLGGALFIGFELGS